MLMRWHVSGGSGNTDGRNDDDWSRDEGYGARDSGNSDVVMRAVVVMRIMW